MMTKKLKCDHCGLRFNPPARGRRPRYCSPSHRQLAYAKRKANPIGYAKKLLSHDLSAVRGRDMARQFVIGILQEFDLVKKDVPREVLSPDTSKELLKRTLAKKGRGGE